MLESFREIIERRKAAGFDEPLEHSQGTATSASSRYELVLWEDWRSDGEYGEYTSALIDAYGALGIFEGNGYWYENAWRCDKTIPEKTATAWENFVISELTRIYDIINDGGDSDYWKNYEEAATA